jgi:hypothetical protein
MNPVKTGRLRSQPAIAEGIAPSITLNARLGVRRKAAGDTRALAGSGVDGK